MATVLILFKKIILIGASNINFGQMLCVTLPGMTGLPNSFAARGPVRHFVSTASCVKMTPALPTKKLGCHEIETNISSAYKN